MKHDTLPTAHQRLARYVSVNVLCFVSIFSLCVACPEALAAPRKRAHAELIHFTDDLTEQGGRLLPGFEHHSMWSGLGRASNGKIFFTASNHQQPGGNVAVYAYDPAAQRLRLLGDLKGISTEVGNWMPEESQYKVHTFLLEHADGRVYFATLDHMPTPFLRGSHLYRIDPETEQVEDASQRLPMLLNHDLQAVANPGENAETSGVFVERFGIKNIGLHPAQPNLLYAMTYPEGHLIQADLKSGDMSVVGRSRNVNYVFYVDAQGNAYYADGDDRGQTLRKYQPTTGQTLSVAEGLPPGDFGAIAPTRDGRFVYFLLAKQKQVYRLDTQADRFEHLMNLCGDNWWRVYNLSLSPDEKSLYYVSNNNDRHAVYRLHLKRKLCMKVLDVDELLGSRNLCFGGVGVWDDQGAFYTPVWTHREDNDDLAILKVSVEKPTPAP